MKNQRIQTEIYIIRNSGVEKLGVLKFSDSNICEL